MYTIVKKAWYGEPSMFDEAWNHDPEDYYIVRWTEKIYTMETALKAKDEWLSSVEFDFKEDGDYFYLCKPIFCFETTERGWKYIYLFKDKREDWPNQIWAKICLEIIDIDRLERR
jgi:hypothetical protein